MKNILVLTDFSGVAENAAKYALRLASTMKAGLTFLHVYPVREETVLARAEAGIDAEFEDAGMEAQSQLQDLIIKLTNEKKMAGNHPSSIRFLVKPGTFADRLAQISREYKVDLVVMGAHQYPQDAGFLFGAHVSQVLEHAQCPVLIIPEGTEFVNIKNIFFTTDLRYCDVQIIRLLTELARPFRATISVLHVCAEGLPDLVEKEGISIFLDAISSKINYPPITYNTLNGVDAEKAINTIVVGQKMDMLAIANRRHHFFKRIFKSSPHTRTDAYTHIPLLVIPAS